jgi:hypothetical protein
MISDCPCWPQHHHHRHSSLEGINHGSGVTKKKCGNLLVIGGRQQMTISLYIRISGGICTRIFICLLQVDSLSGWGGASLTRTNCKPSMMVQIMDGHHQHQCHHHGRPWKRKEEEWSSSLSSLSSSGTGGLFLPVVVRTILLYLKLLPLLLLLAVNAIAHVFYSQKLYY